MPIANVVCHDDNGPSQRTDRVPLPDTCPLCHHAGTQDVASRGYHTGPFADPSTLDVLLRCNRDECRRVHIAHFVRANFDSGPLRWEYLRSWPASLPPLAIDSEVGKVSPDFVRIYQQAREAESLGLTDVCGPAYRKALEFLVKDYLINHKKLDGMQIKQKFLGDCIQDEIDNEPLKVSAKAAAWIGNDETHYSRRWEDKDLSDLKQVIDITMKWIALEIATERLKDDLEEQQVANKMKRPS